jgi:hypothetical protein
LARTTVRACFPEISQVLVGVDEETDAGFGAGPDLDS